MSANRVLYNFTEDELKSICNHVEGYIRDHHMTEIQIWQMHNIAESALEAVRPRLPKATATTATISRIFVGMLDSVYQKSQSIMYIGDMKIPTRIPRWSPPSAALIFISRNMELVPEVLYEHRGTAGLSGRLHLRPRYVGAPRYHELLPV